MLINNYGHLWERRYINWGRQNKRGHLKGYVTEADWADFREQIGIYILYDKDLAPIYMGQAGTQNSYLFDRLKAHTKDRLWNRWEHFSWFGIRRVNANRTLAQMRFRDRVFRVNGDVLLNQIEGALITALEPKLNRQGARWPDVTEYFQEVDDELCELTRRDFEKHHREVTEDLAAIKRRLDI